MISEREILLSFIKSDRNDILGAINHHSLPKNENLKKNHSLVHLSKNRHLSAKQYSRYLGFDTE